MSYKKELESILLCNYFIKASFATDLFFLFVKMSVWKIKCWLLVYNSMQKEKSLSLKKYSIHYYTRLILDRYTKSKKRRIYRIQTRFSDNYYEFFVLCQTLRTYFKSRIRETPIEDRSTNIYFWKKRRRKKFNPK